MNTFNPLAPLAGAIDRMAGEVRAATTSPIRQSYEVYADEAADGIAIALRHLAAAKSATSPRAREVELRMAEAAISGADDCMKEAIKRVPS